MHPQSTTRQGPKPRSLEARLHDGVDRSGGPDACWPWTLCTNEYGYGLLRVGSLVDGSRRMARVHVLAYRLAFGDPPPDKPCILHTCDNPPCCNPSHLFTGTVADNNADMVAKGRARHPNGESNSQAKLTEDAVREIRALGNGARGVELAKRFGVSRSLICHIQKRRKWAHLT